MEKKQGSKLNILGVLRDKALTRDLLVSLLNNSHRDDREVSINDASTDRLPLLLTGATLTVARVVLGQEQANPS